MSNPVDAAERVTKLEAILRELVELKDGPRDADYERRKPAAWDEARRAVGAATPTRNCQDEASLLTAYQNGSLELSTAHCIGGYNVWGYVDGELVYECLHLHSDRRNANACKDGLLARLAARAAAEVPHAR